MALFVTASAFRYAPHNPQAAANLGVTMAAQADRSEDLAEKQDLLERAGACMRIAERRRPEHAPYRERAEEFEAASRDPAGWRLHREEASAAPGSG